MTGPIPTRSDAALLLCGNISGLLFPILSFFVVYLGVLFPFAYFRHDDWVIVASGKMGAENWRSYFEASIQFGQTTQVWFVRPFFKWLSYALFRVFGFHPYPWFLLQMAFLTAAVWLLALTVEGISGSRRKAWQFAALVFGSWHLHMGSLLWLGEGLMNCPQLFALSACLWAFWKYQVTANKGCLLLSLFSLLVSLTVKESSVFVVALLGAFVFCEAPWKGMSFGQRVLRLLPFALVAGAYLVYRLGFVPHNTNYTLEMNAFAWKLSLPRVFLPLILSAAIWGLLGKLPSRADLRGRWLYLPFVLVSFAPYLGHSFFSPGWLLFPGFFLLFVLFLIPRPEGNPQRTARVIALSSLLLMVASLFWLHQLDWWKWGRSTRGIVEVARSLDPKQIDRIDLEICSNPAYPQANASRVIGGWEHLQSLIHLIHGKYLGVYFIDCGPANYIASPSTLHLVWKYPDLVRLN